MIEFTEQEVQQLINYIANSKNQLFTFAETAQLFNSLQAKKMASMQNGRKSEKIK